MKIAIVGSRGIPNNYGGFEQFAEYLSKGLVAKGHEVWVCNPHYHRFSSDELQGVHIKHIYNPETFMGTAGNFIYDLLCLRFAVGMKPDVILVLGYTTSSVWFRFFSFHHSILVTNLDGLEWKRDKWGPVLKQITLWFEKLAVRYGGQLIADHLVIKGYFLEKHQAQTTYIPYGADVFDSPDENALKDYQLEKHTYCMLVARFEAENNIEMIIEGYLSSSRQEKLLLVGNYTTPYGADLYNKYKHIGRLRFLGGIYDIAKLNNLRYFSHYYFHGHSIGGTNPSLLEAMATRVLIIAHENPFNREILGKDAFYFSSPKEINEILKTLNPADEINQEMLTNNVDKIRSLYNWTSITNGYEDLFIRSLEQRNKNR